MSALSNIAKLACFKIAFAWNIIFPIFTFNLFIFVSDVSFLQIINTWICFLTQSTSLYWTAKEKT
jgi:hypothetical protein